MVDPPLAPQMPQEIAWGRYTMPGLLGIGRPEVIHACIWTQAAYSAGKKVAVIATKVNSDNGNRMVHVSSTQNWRPGHREATSRQMIYLPTKQDIAGPRRSSTSSPKSQNQNQNQNQRNSDQLPRARG